MPLKQAKKRVAEKVMTPEKMFGLFQDKIEWRNKLNGNIPTDWGNKRLQLAMVEIQT